MASLRVSLQDCGRRVQAMAVDLHLHTHHSDGTWSPTQVVERAVELKLRHLAITDHDTVAGIYEARTAALGRVDVISGIEINTIWSGDDGRQQDVHILGYFIDPDNAKLKSVLERQQEARIKLVTDTIARLSEIGIKLTLDSVIDCAGIGSIGRPHITQAIVKAGGASDVTEAYERFMMRESPFYVKRESVSPHEAISAIRAAGGVASIAHPGKSDEMKEIILALTDSGLQAVEAYHRRHSVELVKKYIRFANRHKLAITGGSDCHGPFGDHQASIGSISVPLEVVAHLKEISDQNSRSQLQCEV